MQNFLSKKYINTLFICSVLSMGSLASIFNESNMIPKHSSSVTGLTSFVGDGGIPGFTIEP